MTKCAPYHRPCRSCGAPSGAECEAKPDQLDRQPPPDEPPLTVCQMVMTALGMLCLAAVFAIAYCVLTQSGETP